ncbi:MAG: hypothetical protein AB1489_17805 [Acidobacteriota bacterium]
MSEIGKIIPLIILAPLFPVSLIFLFSRVSGWQILARRYPLRGIFPKPKTRMGYGVFRGWIGYNGGIIVASDSAGLYLRAMPVLLSFCHDPIFIPWSEIRQINKEEGILSLGYQIITTQAPEVRFALRPSTFKLIRADAERAKVAGQY